MFIAFLVFSMALGLNHYEVLGVNHGSNEFEIRIAYEEKKAKFSNDLNPGDEYNRDRM